MNSETFDAAEQIRAALKTVDGLRVYEDPAATVDPPAAIVGAPVLKLESISDDPTSAVFPVAVMVGQNKAALNKLLKLIPKVVTAIREQVLDAEITEEITPAVIEIGNTELPGYMIFVEV